MEYRKFDKKYSRENSLPHLIVFRVTSRAHFELSCYAISNKISIRDLIILQFITLLKRMTILRNKRKSSANMSNFYYS